MRRLITTLLALAMLIAFAGPGTAKPDKPGKGKPTDYLVTMAFGDAGTGLATTCSEPILMNGSGGNLSVAQPGLATSIPIGWNRDYPPPGESGDQLTGCHGWLVTEPDGLDVFGGALWLAPGPDGDTVRIEWRFDYYWEYQPNPKNGRLQQHVLEFLGLSGEVGPFDWNSTAPQPVNGIVDLSWFKKIDKEIEKNFESFTDGEGVPVAFVLTIEPSP